MYNVLLSRQTENSVDQGPRNKSNHNGHIPLLAIMS